MNTSDFKYFKFPFPSFNPAQSKVIPLVEKDANLIISFPPGVGKTAVAEACFGYHLQTSNKNVAYVCPLKSLANQKLSDWWDSFKEYHPFLVSGDSDTKIEDADGRFGIFTAESFDSALRRENDFIKNLTCACYDEAHLIGDESRGGAYESSIISLSELCPNIRFVLLSGTLTNAKDVAKWIKVLTGKDTMVATSEWRPVKFSMNFHYVKKYDEIEKALELIEKYKNTKTIIFVHSKITGKIVCEKLKEKKIRHVFHNSTLSENKRKHIESLFSDKYSGIDVIVATSTLAAGVNIG